MTDQTVLDVGAGLAALSEAVAAASPLGTNTLVALGDVIVRAETAVAAVDAAVAHADSQVQTSGVFGIVAGGYGPDLASSLVSQLQALQNEALLLAQRGSLGRMLVNLRTSGG